MLTGKVLPPRALPARSLPPDKRRSGLSFARAVGSFVPRLAAKAFERFGFHTAEIMMEWPRIAGADLAAYTAPERIKWPRMSGSGDADPDGGNRPGGTLLLRVEPARALDVEYRAREIIDRINGYFGYRAVDTLKIVQAPLRAAVQPVLPLTSAAPSPAIPPAPEALQAVPDEPLRSALEKLWSNVSAERTRR